MADLNKVVEQFSKMNSGERTSKYLELSDAGIDDSIAGFLAFYDGDKSLGEALREYLADQEQA